MSMSIGEACIGCGACVRACPVAAIAGERKARHRVDPARCIECGACGRVCPSAAVSDGEGRTVARLMPRTAWRKPSFDLARCISCGACAQKCPAACIELSEGRPGGLEAWPRLAGPEKCVSCGWCEFYCPMDCIELRGPAGKEAS